MSQFKFMPHGEFSVATKGRILVVRTVGPWNEELIKLYSRTVAENVEALAGAPWVLLGVVSDEGLHTPDSFSATVETVRKHRSKGRIASAIVLHNVSAREIVRSMFSRLYSEAGEPFAFFENEESACAWLSAKIANATTQKDQESQ